MTREVKEMQFAKLMNTFSEISFGSLNLDKLVYALLTLLASVIVIAIIMRIVDQLQKRSRFDRAVQGFIRSAIKTGLWVIATAIIAAQLGVKATSFVALLGVIGLALSLSIQGLLGNIFSGFTTLGAKPFVSGDYVEIDGVSGTVDKIELLYTTILTPDNKTVLIPNSQVTASKIINFTGEKERRTNLSYFVPAEADAAIIKEALLDAVREDGRAKKEPAPFVGIHAFGQGTAEYIVRAWVEKEEYLDFTFSVNELVGRIFRERGIEMGYPRLYVRQEDK